MQLVFLECQLLLQLDQIYFLILENLLYVVQVQCLIGNIGLRVLGKAHLLYSIGLKLGEGQSVAQKSVGVPQYRILYLNHVYCYI